MDCLLWLRCGYGAVEPGRNLPYGEAEDFGQRLNQTDAYVWLPVADQFTSTPPEQAEALGRWLDEGRGRQIHFHWGSGTFGHDGRPGEHSTAYDRVYVDALEINYQALDQQMEAAIGMLRAGTVRVTTSAGTDIRFRVGLVEALSEIFRFAVGK